MHANEHQLSGMCLSQSCDLPLPVPSPFPRHLEMYIGVKEGHSPSGVGWSRPWQSAFLHQGCTGTIGNVCPCRELTFCMLFSGRGRFQVKACRLFLCRSLQDLQFQCSLSGENIPQDPGMTCVISTTVQFPKVFWALWDRSSQLLLSVPSSTIIPLPQDKHPRMGKQQRGSGAL